MALQIIHTWQIGNLETTIVAQQFQHCTELLGVSDTCNYLNSQDKKHLEEHLNSPTILAKIRFDGAWVVQILLLPEPQRSASIRLIPK